MTAQIIGDPFAEQPDLGRPAITFSAHIGDREVEFNMSYEDARQFALELNCRLAEAMRMVPRGVA